MLFHAFSCPYFSLVTVCEGLVVLGLLEAPAGVPLAGEERGEHQGEGGGPAHHHHHQHLLRPAPGQDHCRHLIQLRPADYPYLLYRKSVVIQMEEKMRNIIMLRLTWYFYSVSTCPFVLGVWPAGRCQLCELCVD